MAGPLASLFIKLGLDVKEVEQGAKKAESAIGGITKGKVIQAAGAAVATGLAFATKGALAMEDASARFRAETGASAEEAEHFAQKLNALSGSSLVPLNELDASMIKIRTDLGLAGDEADRAIDQFAAFERATGQGADAVGAFDDILDAWGLTAADTGKIMDTLVASHQKFGGSVADQQTNLAKLSGVVQAYGGTWEDANKILNLANASGIEGTEMLKGLSTAVKKFPAGTTFDEMFQSLVDIEDPTERATKAIEMFGIKVGPKLAATVAHGTTSLDDFVLATEDVTGATAKAADALDDTWGSKIRKALNYASSLLTGFAMNLGPMLTGAMSGVSLLGALGVDKAALAKAGGVLKAGLLKMLATIGLEQAGTALATKLMGAFSAALPIVGVVAAGVAIGAVIGKAIMGPEVDRATKDMQTKVSGALEGAITDQDFDRQRAVLEKGLKDFDSLPFADLIYGDQRKALVDAIADLDAKQAQMKEASAGIGAAAAEGLSEGSSEVARAGQKARSVWRRALDRTHFSTDEVFGFGQVDFTKVEGVLDAAGNRIAGGTAKLRDALRSGLQGAAQTADAGMQAIQSALAKPPKLISMKQRLKQFDKAARQAWKNMRAAVKADDPVNAAYWEQQYLQVRDGQRALKNSTTKTMADIKRDMRVAGYAIPREVGEGVRRAKASVASLGKVDATSWGRHLGETFAAGLTSATPAARTAAFGIAGAVAGGLKFSAPPKVGPLKDIRSWGPHMIDQWAKGTESGLGRAESAATAWAKAATPSMGSRWQPAAAYAGGARARGAMRGLRGGGGGDTNIHVGTLVANDAGIDQLRKRMDNRLRMRRRNRRVYDSPNAQER